MANTRECRCLGLKGRNSLVPCAPATFKADIPIRFNTLHCERVVGGLPSDSRRGMQNGQPVNWHAVY
ncbi:hypothetical protein ALP26_03464 [Pseudomonas savastanoi pv. glycinea]|uniref:Uncharacterized protein n=2 Tax=Pseudomonas savastanoi TaxID=29438 RepID=A0A0P9TUN2_PSESG|nr:hypothetical protein ALO37_200153 [Pseudomonas savastanoi pv. glycinea]KPY10782.1 Unknown protein sequence [Pseudomonas savastanoi pv. phaseolicola]MBN4178376.1 hypothetical protein [Pseudomonas savastanoi pv. phaseolicola]MBN4179106.1 hypothetical protein [Pseudomonas savastanoi pv. phaseolicola]RMM58788.1 hypothetical protein ALQ75_02325 [Pseudomonas savastanoi pv. glycinea]